MYLSAKQTFVRANGTDLDIVYRAFMIHLLGPFTIVRVDGRHLWEAVRSGFEDVEDGVAHEAAVHAGTDGIVTRNVDDVVVALRDKAQDGWCCGASNSFEQGGAFRPR